MTSQALTWNDLAEEYYKATGRQARRQPMDIIFKWAEKQPNLFFVSKNGTLHKIIDNSLVCPK